MDAEKTLRLSCKKALKATQSEFFYEPRCAKSSDRISLQKAL